MKMDHRTIPNLTLDNLVNKWIYNKVSMVKEHSNNHKITQEQSIHFI
jgi:hypothetical protein